MQTPTLTKNEAPTVPVETPVETRVDTPRVRPLANVAETSDAYTVELLVPGVGKDAVELEVERGVLQVRAESALAAPEGLKARVREFGGVSYERRFTLPEDVDPQAIEASLADGLLTVVLPKREEEKPRTIAIA